MAVTADIAAGAAREDIAEGNVAFDGERGDLLRLVVKNFLLTLVTVGIYRFWAKTNLRRWIWRNVRFGGDTLEYTGTGKELFLGFLVAVAVLVPLGIAVGVLHTIAQRMGPGAQAVVMLIFYAGFYLLALVAIWRARQYRLTRTLWRGVRAGQEGASLGYAGRVIGWGLFSLVTLGFGAPWSRAAIHRYTMGNTRFGSGRFSSDAKGSELFAGWIWPAGAFFAMLVAIFFAVSAHAIDLQWMAQTGQLPAGFKVGGTLFLAPILFLAWVALMIRYRAWEFRYLAGRTRLGDVTLSSNLRSRRVVLLVLGYLGALVATGIVLGTVVYALGSIGTSSELMPFAVAVAYLLFVAAAGILKVIIFDFGLLALVCRSLTVHNVTGLTEVVQGQGEIPKRGEGLLDALDVGGAF